MIWGNLEKKKKFKSIRVKKKWDLRAQSYFDSK